MGKCRETRSCQDFIVHLCLMLCLSTHLGYPILRTLLDNIKKNTNPHTVRLKSLKANTQLTSSDLSYVYCLIFVISDFKVFY